MPGPTSVNLFMGQGVIADLSTCTLSSGDFESCAPVIFFNSANNKGALYHFPGLSDPADIRSRPNDKQAVKHLCEQVQPTHVYILTGRGTYDIRNLGGPMQLALGHIQAVEDIVREVSGQGVNISYTAPQNEVRNGASQRLSQPRQLTADEQRVDFRVPQSVTAVDTVSISAANGVLRFANGLNDVDLSLTHRNDVACLLAATNNTTCFAGNPNGNTGGDGTDISHHPERLELTDDEITAQKPTVLALQAAYEKNLTPEERAALKHVGTSSDSGSDRDVDEKEPQLYLQPDLDASDDDGPDVRAGQRLGDGDSDPDEPEQDIQNDVDSDDDRSIRGDDNAQQQLPPLPDSDDDDDRSIGAGDDVGQGLPPLPDSDDDEPAVVVQQNVVVPPPVQNGNAAPLAPVIPVAPVVPPRQNVAAALGRVPPMQGRSEDDVAVGTQRSVREQLRRSASTSNLPKAGRISL